MESCPFCTPDPSRVLFEDELVRGVSDAYPLSPGHALVVPRRHVASWFDATEAEQQALTAGIARARELAVAGAAAHGFTIGINDGAAAGQTVPHLHVHVIPRWRGDVEDPRGGVRWVIPSRAAYWPTKP